MRDTLLAWAAGIIDGEGTITICDNGNPNQSCRRGIMTPRVLLTMTCKLTVSRFYDIVKLGSIRVPTAATSKHKEQHHWRSGGADAVSVCKILTPYLFTKKVQAEVIVQFSKDCMVSYSRKLLTEEQRVLRELYLDRIQLLNKRGALS